MGAEEDRSEDIKIEPYKTFMDGGAWVCCGESFINMQESENFAFGDTEQEAINNYILLFKF